jgi:hypothetical protein
MLEGSRSPTMVARSITSPMIRMPRLEKHPRAGSSAPSMRQLTMVCSFRQIVNHKLAHGVFGPFLGPNNTHLESLLRSEAQANLKGAVSRIFLEVGLLDNDSRTNNCRQFSSPVSHSA